MKRYVFLDRDGTICEDADYLSDYRKMEFYPFALDALRIIIGLGYGIVVVSNQSGIAREKFTLEEAERQKMYLLDFFSKEGVIIDDYRFCPHHPEGTHPDYSIECDCRKPFDGMIRNAVGDVEVDWDGSFVVGDKTVDTDLALNVGAKPVLVLTGYGMKHRELIDEKLVLVCDDLLDFANKLKEGSV